MTLTNPDGQLNPEGDVDYEAVEIERRVTAVTKALDGSQMSIHRWFWKSLIALNLVLWSVALPIAFVLRFG